MEREKEEKASILVVEDDLEFLDFLSSQLAAQGYRVSTACNGVEAMKQLRVSKFHVVVSDFRMPGMDGIQVLDEIKRIDPQIQVIMASGHGDIETAVSAMKKGAYDFLEKPIVMSELLALIKKALEKKELGLLIALYEMSKLLFSSVRLEPMLESMMNRLLELFHADEGSIMMMDEQANLYIACSHGIPEEYLYQTSLKLGERVAGMAGHEGREFLIVGGLDRYPEFSGIETKPRIRSSIVVPVYFQQRLLGVFNLNRIKNTDDFSVDDLQTASVFASQIAQSLHLAKLHSTLETKIRELKIAYTTLETTKGLLNEPGKLASISQLISCAAHEINNPLTAIIGYTDLALNFSALDENAKSHLSVVMKEALRCKEIVQNLLHPTTGKMANLKHVDLDVLVDDTFKIAMFDINAVGAHLHKYLDAPLASLSVEVNPGQIKQVLLNLLRNACQALSKRNGEREIEIRLSSNEGIVRLSCFNNGPSIPDEYLEKIFEPFFSTKSEDIGTGLGLNISTEIMKSHGGSIDVKNGNGTGVTFTLEFPALPT